MKTKKQKKLENFVAITRASKGMSQEMLANLTDVSVQTIRSIEEEKYELSVYLALKIAEVLHEDVSHIFRLG